MGGGGHLVATAGGLRAVPEDTIWRLEPHTSVKHDIYDGYLDAWFPIILRTFRSGTYAEGFAGPGVYRDGEAGSPIRALRRLRAMRDRWPELRDRPVRFVLVEKRRDRVEQLLTEFRRELAHPMPGGEYRDAALHILVRQGTCEDTLPGLLAHVDAKKAPVLGVLDSFGGGSTQQLIRRFARQKGGEVVITVEPQHFVRNLDPARADEVFGGPEWRDVDELPPHVKRTYIARKLTEAIRAAGFRFVISFGLETARGNELLLQFATNHPTGLDRFKDSLWGADPIGGARFRDPNDPEQMLLDLTPEPAVAPLRRLLLDHLCGRPARTATVAELRTFTREHTLYRHKDTAPALDDLLARSEVSTGGGHTRVHARTPGLTPITARSTEQFTLA